MLTAFSHSFLLTHLYEFFGALLGCSDMGMSGFSAYMGQASMYSVHKFMDLSDAEVTYFIEQVGLAAASFGVTEADATAVGMTLESVFGVRCGPPTALIKSQGAQLMSICTDPKTCPMAAMNASCSAYSTPMEPMTANSSSSATGTSTASMTMASTVPTGAAAAQGMGVAAAAVGIAAFLL